MTPRFLARSAAALLVLIAAVTAWAAPASAALPDRFAFVLWNGAATVPTGTTPAATSVVTGPVGRYRVIFPGAGAPGGVVHVTAINTGPFWCQVNTFGPAGPDEVVYIDCYRAGGVPAFTAFTAFFESSSPPPIPINGRFGYVDSQASGALVSQYNSMGSVNNSTLLSTGQWMVRMPALGTAGPLDGSAQATAVNAGAVRCKVRNWQSLPAEQRIFVSCFGPGGAPVNTRFTLTWQYNQSLYGAGWPPKYFGYLFYAPGAGPATTNFNSQLGLNANTVSGGAGLYLVRFPRIGFTPDTIQVTAAGGTSDFCNLLTYWTHSAPDTLVRDVSCYNNAGTHVNTGFLISDNAAL